MTTTQHEMDVFEQLEYIERTAREYAEAKANAYFMQEFRKTIKARGMKDSEDHNGETAAVKQERDAYASFLYEEHLRATETALAIAEELRWRMVAAEARIEVWRTLESSKRMERKVI